MKKLFNNRKALIFMLFIILVCVLSLTIAYASLSMALEIKGNAEVVAANWNVRFCNIISDYTDANNNVSLVDDTVVSFNAILDEPGDYYYFTVDIVNEGSIDAIIDSIEKKPDLTAEQAKYIKYEISYASGDAISTKQVVEANSYVRLKVRVEYRSDIVVSDLPTSQTVLNLSFQMNYVQKDEEGINVPNSGFKTYRVVSGDIDTPGSEICLGDECFYVLITDTDSENNKKYVYLFAKYNLYVESSVSEFGGIDLNPIHVPLVYDEIKQDSRAVGVRLDDDGIIIEKFIGVMAFSENKYWNSVADFNPYDTKNKVAFYSGKYGLSLIEKGYNIVDYVLPTSDFLELMGCNFETTSCEDLPDWIKTTSYWTCVAKSDNEIYAIVSGNGLAAMSYNMSWMFGVRPIIVFEV